MPQETRQIENKKTVHRPHRRRKRFWRRLINHAFYGLQQSFYHVKVGALRLLRRFCRFCYRIGPMKCLYVSGVAVVFIVLTVLFISLPASRAKKAEALAALAAPTPSPTLVPLVTVVPEDFVGQQRTLEVTPEPTPELRLEKGDKSADVTTLQQKLMELGYLGIDEPTDYFGNATKSAVQLFQRQRAGTRDAVLIERMLPLE